MLVYPIRRLLHYKLDTIDTFCKVVLIELFGPLVTTIFEACIKNINLLYHPNKILINTKLKSLSKKYFLILLEDLRYNSKVCKFVSLPNNKSPQTQKYITIVDVAINDFMLGDSSNLVKRKYRRLFNHEQKIVSNQPSISKFLS